MLKLQGRNTGIKWIIIAAPILIALIFAGSLLFPSEPGMEPQKAVEEVVKNTERVRSYEYSIKMTTTIDGKKEVTSDISGQRESAKRLHFKGKIFDSDVDFYLLDQNTYYKDQLTGEWTKMDSNELNQQDIFMQEINPLAGFRYKELLGAKFEGIEKVDDKKYWVYSAQPIVNNQYMEIMWKDFRYKFWVNPRGLTMSKGQITAVSKNKPEDKLEVLVQFKNLDSKIQIAPPK